MSGSSVLSAAVGLGVRWCDALSGARTALERGLATNGALRWHERRRPGGDVIETVLRVPHLEVRLGLVDDGTAAWAHPLFAGLVPVVATVAWAEGPEPPEVGALRRVWEPFSPVERGRIAALSSFAPPSPVPGDALIVVRDHPLIEKIGLIEQLLAVASEVWFVPKVDTTKYRTRTLATLAAMGARLVLDTAPGRVVAELKEARPVGPVVVVDDGGSLIAAALDDPVVGPELIAIETTTRGSRLLAEADLMDKVVDLSATPTKVDLSGPIATSCVREMLVHTAHDPLAGERAHVVGFGAIGSEVARILRALDLVVTVSDPETARRDAAAADGFEAFPSVRAALTARPHRHLIGCSGHRAVDLATARALTDRGIAWAVSSQDLDIVVREAHEAGLVSTAGGSHLSVTHSDGHQLRILGDGHALNLFHAEGVPEPDFHRFQEQILDEVRARLAAIASPFSSDSQGARAMTDHVLDFDAVANASLRTEPFEWARLEATFVSREIAEDLRATFPTDFYGTKRRRLGESSTYGGHHLHGRGLVTRGTGQTFEPSSLSPSWLQLVDDLMSDEYLAAMEALTGIDLTGTLRELICFRQPKGGFLDPHPDNPEKPVSHVIYFSDPTWSEDDGGCLGILRSRDAADIAEVVEPRLDRSVVLVRSDSSWHGYPPVRTDAKGDRMALQLFFCSSKMEFATEYGPDWTKAPQLTRDLWSDATVS